MAKHFREPEGRTAGTSRRDAHGAGRSGGRRLGGSTEAMRRITRSPYGSWDKENAVRGDVLGDSRETLPYGQAATYHYSYPGAVVTDEEFREELQYGRSRAGIYVVGRTLLLLVAWALRLAALATFLLVVANVIAPSLIEGPLTRLTDLVTSYMPWRGLDFWVLTVETPFGGLFRGDLALLTLALFMCDWVVCRIRTHLR